MPHCYWEVQFRLHTKPSIQILPSLQQYWGYIQRDGLKPAKLLLHASFGYICVGALNSRFDWQSMLSLKAQHRCLRNNHKNMRGVNNTVWIFSLTPATSNLAITKICMPRIIGCTKPHIIKFFFSMGLSNLLLKPPMGLSSKVSLGSKFWNIHVDFLHSFHRSPSPDWLAPILFPFSSSRSQSKPAIFLHASSSSTKSWNRTQNGTQHSIWVLLGFFFPLNYHQTDACRKLSKTNPMHFPWAATHSQEPVTVLYFATGTVWCVSLFCPFLNAWHSSALKVSTHFNHEITQYFQRSLTCSQGASGTPIYFLYPPDTTYVLSYTKWWRG